MNRITGIVSICTVTLLFGCGDGETHPSQSDAGSAGYYVDCTSGDCDANAGASGMSEVVGEAGASFGEGGTTIEEIGGESSTGGVTADTGTGGSSESIGGSDEGSGGLTIESTGGATQSTGGESTSSQGEGGSDQGIGGSSEANGGSTASVAGSSSEEVGGSLSDQGGASSIGGSSEETGGVSSEGGATIEEVGGASSGEGGSDEGSGGSCQDGYSMCGILCKDLQTDRANCGACGQACEAEVGEVCIEGTCGCDGVQPERCDDACVDLATDPNHCGACETVCDWTCTDGVCTYPIDISLEDSKSCTLLSDHSVACWGDNSDWTITVDEAYDAALSKPVLITELGHDVVQIVAGRNHACALMFDGRVRCNGDNYYGQLGFEDSFYSAYLDPRWPYVPDFGDVAQLSVGEDRTCALKLDGTVWCWGDWNIPGDIMDESYPTPTRIEGLSGVTMLTVGLYHVCVMTPNGVMCWGDNYNGQLGYLTENEEEYSLTPGFTVGLSGEEIVEIEAGLFQTCIRYASNTVACWGVNGWPTWTAANNDERYSPIRNISSLSSIVSLSAGDYHVCAIQSGGTLYCWGNNEYYQLGAGSEPVDGTYNNEYDPLLVSSVSGVDCVGTGRWHTCVLQQDRSILCWGKNEDGQLGDGTMTDSYVPVRVIGTNG